MDKLIKIGLLGCLLFFVNSVVVAGENDYFDEHAKGWHWYDDPKQSPDQDEEDSPVSPVMQMNAVRATIESSLNKAILYPNKENVKNYITLQNELMSHASQFDHNWQAVLLDNPDLNYSLIHPTNNVAKQVEYDQEKLKEDAVIHELAKKGELVFFYRSTCPYCQRFAPIVKDFAESYGITITPITTDGISLPEFPNSYPDNGQSAKLNVTVEPALFVFNRQTHQVFPIVYGMTSQAEIKKNILNIVTHFEGEVHDE
jgi:conjugal transfer pilus assembly protein TraF